MANYVERNGDMKMHLDCLLGKNIHILFNGIPYDRPFVKS